MSAIGQVFRCCFAVFIFVLLLSEAMAQIAPTAKAPQRKDVAGKCFETTSQQSPDFKVEVSICFEEKSLDRVEFAHVKLPDGRWMIDGVSDGWARWDVKRGKLFLYKENGLPLDYCVMHLKDKILTFDNCVPEIKLLSAHIWRLEEK